MTNSGPRRRLLNASALMGALALGLAAAGGAQAQTRSYNIPAEPLSQALRDYGRASGRQIIFTEDLVRGRSAPAVKGQFSADGALARLLEGAGLASETTPSGAVMIVRAPASPQRLGAQAESQPTALDELVVTAQKKAEKIQDVPASISAISGDRLETQGATQLADYAAYVPGLQVDSGGSPGQTMITLRGLSPLTSTSMVGTYIDDSPLGSSAGWLVAPSFALDLMPYDIQRVEVLRGPQGTLYGANTMGGLLKYVTNAPDPNRFSARLGTEVSTIHGAGDLGWGVRGGVNLPLVADKLAMSVTAFDQHTPGYIDNALTGAKDENGVEQKGGRVALLWNATDNLVLKLSAMGQDVDSKNNAAVALVPGTQTPIYGELSSAHLIDQPFKSRLRYYTATFDWDLGWANFVSATSYSKTKVVQVNDSTQTFGPYFPLISAALPQYTGGAIVPPGLAPSDLLTDLKKFTQEFRLSSHEGQRLAWLLGAFYTDEDAFMLQSTTAEDMNGVPVPGDFNPFFYATIPTSYREAAVFANVTYKFTDTFDVSVGGRYARNKQDFTLNASGPFLAFVGADGTTIAHSEEGVFTYSVAPRWHLSEDTMVYARVASGYRPGGPNSPLPDVPPQVNSDRIVNYEAGFKSMFLDRRAMIDLALFRVDWQDIQAFGISGTGISYLANGGKARSQGLELSASYAPVRGLRLGFTTAYTDAKLIDAIPSLGGMPGDQLTYTPRWSGAATADWEFPLGDAWTGQAGGGVRYIGERFVGFPAGFRYAELPGYTAVDLHAGVTNDRWSARLFVKNATDKRAYLTPTFQPAQTDATVLQPRTIGLALEARF